MEQYVIKGGNPLVGEVEIGGAKNAALAILSAAVMTDETVTIENVPNVRDTNVLLNAIEEIGARVERLDAHTVRINGSFIRDFNVDNEFIRKIRASYYLIGALLGKYKRAEVALPGGCNIGVITDFRNNNFHHSPTSLLESLHNNISNLPSGTSSLSSSL